MAVTREVSINEFAWLMWERLDTALGIIDGVGNVKDYDWVVHEAVSMARQAIDTAMYYINQNIEAGRH